MRWDFILFFASLVVAAIGGEWGAYLGVAGMAAFGIHGLFVKLPQRARKMATALGLIASGTIFVALLIFYLKPIWFGLQDNKSSLDNTILLECYWSQLPKEVPSYGLYYWELTASSADGGYVSI
jgi:hypothetical protein